MGTVHTNTIEGFYGLVKSGIRGTYHSVSRKWLQGYLNEFSWRYNRRDESRAMFDSLVNRAAAE
jgi:transposase